MSCRRLDLTRVRFNAWTWRPHRRAGHLSPGSFPRLWKYLRTREGKVHNSVAWPFTACCWQWLGATQWSNITVRIPAGCGAVSLTPVPVPVSCKTLWYDNKYFCIHNKITPNCFMLSYGHFRLEYLINPCREIHFTSAFLTILCSMISVQYRHKSWDRYYQYVDLKHVQYCFH